MLRRTCLKIVMAFASLTFIAWDWVASLAQGAERAGVPRHLIPSSPSAAISTNNPDRICAFILAYPAAAAGASVHEKARMLSLMRGWISSADVWTSKRLQYDQPQYEHAIVTLLRGTERRPAEFRQLIDALGGKASIPGQLPKMQNPELRTLAERGAR